MEIRHFSRGHSDFSLYNDLRIGYNNATMSAIRPQQLPRRHDTRRVSRVQRGFTGVVLALAVIVMGDALFGGRGLVTLTHKQQELDRLNAAVEQQKAKVEQLKEKARRYTEEPSAIEERARRDFNFVRPGEKLIIIRDVPSPRETH
jgi:cell division protein FtsB